VRSSFSQDRLTVARTHLLDFLRLPNLKDLVFLDIGCGSGIHSLASLISGAAKVISVDVDPDSITATRTLRSWQGNPDNWEIASGSILDPVFLKSLVKADIVYSWGVLHHTGDLWQALTNSARCLQPGALFYIAIYDKTPQTPYWIDIKKRYNSCGWWGKRNMEWRYIIRHFFWPIYPRRVASSLRAIISYKAKRGMAFMTDVRDWLGGWPFEPATETEICNFCQSKLGLRQLRIKSGEANIEYLFQNGDRVGTTADVAPLKIEET
jgi:SAM-dependent methyltransferase